MIWHTLTVRQTMRSLVLSACATAAFADTNGQKSFCELIHAENRFCTCTDTLRGGDAVCSGGIEGLETLELTVGFEPCALPAVYKFDFHDSHFGFSKHFEA